jgi:predicted MPP superfamily phosphohydrolase
VQAAVPAAAAPARPQPALHAGEFPLDGNRRLYISRGVGHLLQVRFNVRPEVTAFELRPA